MPFQLHDSQKRLLIKADRVASASHPELAMPSPWSSHRLSRSPRRGAGKFAKAVEALAESRRQGIEPFRFQGVLDLVIESAAREPPLDHGHREWAAAGLDDGLEGFARALGHDLARCVCCSYWRVSARDRRVLERAIVR